MKSLNLPLEKMIGQDYVGASSMSGKEKIVQAIVKESCPLAVYVHCSAHVLNLVLVKSCAIPEIHSSYNFIWDIVRRAESAITKTYKLSHLTKKFCIRPEKSYRNKKKLFSSSRTNHIVMHKDGPCQYQSDHFAEN